MASDIMLVLRAEHRELLNLADQCARPGRGFQDPQDELRRRLAAHTAAAQETDLAHLLSASDPETSLREMLASSAARITDAPGAGLADEAVALVMVERERLMPALERILIADRRRMGKVFRIHRERELRRCAPHVRRHRSQTELYDLARRAGIDQRSRMTQAQLDEAVAAWERANSPRARTT